jgi:uncharacterized protein
MEIWMLVVIAALTGVMGFFLGRYVESRSGRVKAMREELESQKKEFAEYRSQVSRHFSKTAALFSTLTGTYRNLYHHLADGCEHLAEMPAKTLFSGATAVLEAKNETPPETGKEKRETSEQAPGAETEEGFEAPDSLSKDEQSPFSERQDQAQQPATEDDAQDVQKSASGEAEEPLEQVGQDNAEKVAPEKPSTDIPKEKSH